MEIVGRGGKDKVKIYGIVSVVGLILRVLLLKELRESKRAENN